MALTHVTSNFLEEVKIATLGDEAYQLLVEQVKDRTVRQYWLEDKLLYGKGSHLFVLGEGGLHYQLIKKCHDSP